MKIICRLLVLIIASVFLYSGGLFQGKLNRIRDEYHLTYNPPLENAPPELVLATTLLGGFRGMIVNVLWIRAIELQQEGKFFELVQLHDWICKMEPRLSQIWVYNAWNLAYNVSVECPTPEERWNWVRAGIRLLRDQGIQYNRKAPKLYKELGWIYYHKLGQVMDDFHLYYKNQFAAEMELVLGPELDVAALAEAPDAREVLLEDQAVKAFVQELSAKGLDVFKENQKLIDGTESFPDDIRILLESDRNAVTYKRLFSFLRKKQLIEKYKLDPAYMLMLMGKFGPLDWRYPAAHNIYWNSKALEIAQTIEEKRTIHYDRMVYYSIQQIYRQGRVIKVVKGKYLFSQDYRFLDRMKKIYNNMLEKYDYPETIMTGRKNFLEEALWILYLNGQKSRANEYYRDLRKEYPSERYLVPLDVFVYDRIKENMKELTRYKAREGVNGYLTQALWWLAAGQDEKSAGLEALAKMIYNKWNTEYPSDRMKLPLFTKLVSDTKKQIRRTFPPEMIASLVSRGILEEEEK